MKNQKALIQRKNDVLGKGLHYNMGGDGDGIISVGIRKAGKYKFALVETKESLTGKLSTSLSYSLENFVLLKRLYHYFGKNINFNDFYKKFREGLKSTFKKNNLESRINISIETPAEDDLRYKEKIIVGGLGYFFPYKRISDLSQKLIKQYNKKKEIIHPLNKINQDVEERLDPGAGIEEQVKELKVGLKNTLILNKLTEKIEKIEKKLENYLLFINHQRGIHITAESNGENAYEILADFYRQLLNPTKEQEDFDIEEARKEIEAGWGKNKQLAS